MVYSFAKGGVGRSASETQKRERAHKPHWRALSQVLLRSRADQPHPAQRQLNASALALGHHLVNRFAYSSPSPIEPFAAYRAKLCRYPVRASLLPPCSFSFSAVRHLDLLIVFQARGLRYFSPVWQCFRPKSGDAPAAHAAAAQSCGL